MDRQTATGEGRGQSGGVSLSNVSKGAEFKGCSEPLVYIFPTSSVKCML